jgi:hypothetical protein
VGNNTLLEELDISNCPNLKQAVDLSGCTAIKKVYASGTGVSAVLLPKGGLLNLLVLPAVANTLILDNQNFISNQNLFFTPTSITTLYIKNCSKINVTTIVNNLTKISRISVNNLVGSSDNSDSFYAYRCERNR